MQRWFDRAAISKLREAVNRRAARLTPESTEPPGQGSEESATIEPVPEAQPREGTLSIVVPVYNVEPYLEACLDSVVEQRYQDIEVIVVDDGSPDGSADLALEYAQRDPRFRVIRRENGGLGAARNTGVAAATGEYLTFLDSDDSIPPGAYEVMMRSLRESGSDLAVGRMVRVRDGETVRLDWSDQLHRTNRVGISTEDYPHILRDFYTPNKVYRSAFWRGHEFRFREGVLFEDQPLITEMYCKAHSIDVIADPVYRWLMRSDGSSLSQGMHRLENIALRTVALKLTADVLRDHGSATLWDAWLWTLLEFHFPAYLAAAATRPEGAFDAAVDMVRTVVDDQDLTRIDGVSAQNKVIIYLGLHFDRETVAKFVTEGGRSPERFQTAVSAGKEVVRLPFFDSERVVVPPDLFALSESQFELQHWISSCAWEGDGRLVVTGFAYIEFLDSERLTTEIRLDAVDRRTGRRVPFEVSASGAPWPGPLPTHSWISYVGGQFSAALVVGDWVAEGRTDLGPLGEWELELTVRTGRVERTVPAGNLLSPASLVGPPAFRLDDGVIAIARLSPVETLALAVHRSGVTIESVSASDASDGAVQVTFVTAGRIEPSGARLVNDQNKRRHSLETHPTGDGRWTCVVPSSVLDRHAEIAWYLRVETSAGAPDLRGRSDLLADSRKLGVEVRLSPSLRVLFRGARRRAIVDHVRMVDGCLEVAGSVVDPQCSSVRLHLSGDEVSTPPVAAPVSDGEFEGRVALVPADAGLESGGVLPCADYALMLEDASEPDSPVTLGWRADLPVAIPYDETDDTVTVRLRSLPHQRLAVRILPPLPLDERGSYAQNVLRQRWFAVTDRPVRDTVVFHCPRGTVGSDAQAEMHRYLQAHCPHLESLWVVTDYADRVPDGASPLLRGSAAWYKAIATSRLVVVDDELPPSFVKAAGQSVLRAL